MLALLIIGALNWGLIGFFRYDLVAAVFGGQLAMISRIVYGLVGLAGIWSLTLLFRRDTDERVAREHHSEYRHVGQS
jgi:uncharacterized membrane protein YuzA (DUF378 family)